MPLKRPARFSASPQLCFHRESTATSIGRCMRATLAASIRRRRTWVDEVRVLGRRGGVLREGMG